MPAFSMNTEPTAGARLHRSTSILTSARRRQEVLLRCPTSIWVLESASSRAVPRRGWIFDLGLGADKSAAFGGAAASAAPPAPPAAEPALSIDFDLPMGEKPAQSTSVDAAPSLAAIDFDLEHRLVSVKRKPRCPGRPRWIWPPSVSISVRPAAATVQAAPRTRDGRRSRPNSICQGVRRDGRQGRGARVAEGSGEEGDTAQQQQAQTMLRHSADLHRVLLERSAPRAPIVVFGIVE